MAIHQEAHKVVVHAKATEKSLAILKRSFPEQARAFLASGTCFKFKCVPLSSSFTHAFNFENMVNEDRQQRAAALQSRDSKIRNQAWEVLIDH